MAETDTEDENSSEGRRRISPLIMPEGGWRSDPEMMSRATIDTWSLPSLPTVSHFDDDEFQERHRTVLAGYLAVGLISSILTLGAYFGGRSGPISHTLIELSLLFAPAFLLLSGRLSRISMASATVTGILIGCGLLIHSTGGLIESHFMFFVAIPLIALYTDYRPFLLAIGYVAAGHGLVGAIDPESMYNHQAAIDAPIVWGLIHAGYVLALSGVMLIHWHHTDRKRIELKQLVDDLRSTQERLQQAEKLEAIGSLAAGVAHEINTPVQFVTDNLQFLKETSDGLTSFKEQWSSMCEATLDNQPAPDQFAKAVSVYETSDIEFGLEEMPPAIDQCLEGMQRVAEIVRSMKNFSHPSDEIVGSNLNELILSTITVSRAEWKYVADVVTELDSDLAPVPVPPGSFNQAILNMIVNAAHAIEERQETAPGPGTITIRTETVGTNAQVSISDNGGGIPEEIRRRVFEQFFTTKTIGKGTGQGLAIAHSVVTQLGGNIELSSEVGAGTTFVLTIPFESELATEPEAETEIAHAA
jgi:signal transduction histidine kinase